ncbi:tripartite tricarboxylate transporter substrate binding protein [Pollutimonas bauzanensis]|jgi:tripartite-type tricarboxylate transporter receptor subunit TctC|uniref:Bug family tripartite tricarboxylate transporter substrate binding protein n=1 Tax=Pollutimonas bauzanensis TaxID=658167 RepID=UPI00333F8617
MTIKHSPARRSALKALGVPALLGLCPPSVRAQGFPSHSITLICPFGAGGSVDQYMRVLSQTASRHFGQSIVIDNKPGAGGALSAAILSKVRPDGYTLGMLSSSAFRAPWLEPKMAFSPLTDFSYIIGMTSLEFCAVVRADSPIKSFAQFMEIGKEKPGSIQYAAGDPTTSVPITMVSIQKKYGVEFQHIPYKSGADMAVALAGGHVDAVIDSVGTYVPYIRSGKLRLLGALGETRFKAWPDVPTAREQGYDVVLSSPLGIAGPAGLPVDIVQRLHDGFRRAMQDPETTAVLDTLNQPEWYRDPAAFEAYAHAAYKESGDLLKNAGLI